MIAGSANTAKNLPRIAPQPQRERAVRPRPEKRTRAVHKASFRRNVALACAVLLFFALSIVVIMRFAYIDEVNDDIRSLKRELSSAKEETQKLRLQMNMTLSLDEVRKRAGSDLGMEAPGEDQKVYVTLPEEKQDTPAADDTQNDGSQKHGLFDMLLGLLD